MADSPVTRPLNSVIPMPASNQLFTLSTCKAFARRRFGAQARKRARIGSLPAFSNSYLHCTSQSTVSLTGKRALASTITNPTQPTLGRRGRSLALPTMPGKPIPGKGGGLSSHLAPYPSEVNNILQHETDARGGLLFLDDLVHLVKVLIHARLGRGNRRW